ncbi:glucans biosynthesis glucosyltransferase MdoH [Pseudoroseomonas ludipueritiae]|uniref:Glucans biosynthesis glucosyltransferase H n=1 Tax=Pseudoroseomonas ludipueritiae TaxID=198093 RepID=A0ABR7RCM1_9PROT|nr:glucans biosynthesis glucosyltransferase MdoH [Pseudoroseomonas ludipueritiae]
MRKAPSPVALRRLAFALLCLCISAGLLALLWRVLSPGGWTGWEVAILLAYGGTVPWSAISAGNALIGLALRLRGRGLPAAPAGTGQLRTAIALCIRNEDMDAVLAPLPALLDGLEAAGQGHRFVLWFLSDTQDPVLAAREEEAVAGFAASRAGRPIAVRYRRRRHNTGFKAGNVMEFLDHHAAGLDLMLGLDADSAMAAPAVLRLVAEMEADPKLAILQQLIAGRPAEAAFARLFQFGMRAGMRSWASGQNWWQGDEGPYWGHNAIIRITAFRAHARLDDLPGGHAILSHDQVEAVRLHAAGWKVRCLAEDSGSLEASPPSLPEFLARDRRWGAGNMQYWRLLPLPWLRPVGRWQLAQAVLLFLTAPLSLLLLVAALGNVATGGAAATPPGALALLFGATWLASYAPKLAGYAEALLRPALAARFGGRRALLRGAMAEMTFAFFSDPLNMASKGFFLLAMPFRRGSGWGAQNRAARGVAWRDAARLLWPQTVLGAAGSLLLLAAGGTAWLWGAPFLLPLLLAIPFCVATASPALSAWMRARRICATPEELEGLQQPVDIVQL